MKLEPGRTSLSGRPEFLRPAVVQTPAIAPRARKCSMCGVSDIASEMEGEPHHSVTIDLRWIPAKNEAEAKQQVLGRASRGWRYKFHLGRYAMERDICRPCLIRHQEMEQEFKRKRSNESKSSMQSDSYYLAVCGE